MEFIGRTIELEKLQKEYNSSSSFVVIYGRRRIGKTTLIKEFLKTKENTFYFLATEEVEKMSIERLKGVIVRKTGDKQYENATFNKWEDLFLLISSYKEGEKKVFVIDEFPYLVKNNPAFPSILQNAWDEIFKEQGVMLILSGSHTSMMEKYALSYSSPLYGRRTAQIKLGPLPFTEVYKAQEKTFEESTMEYSITGGVPKYIELFEGKRLEENIEEQILSKEGFLYEEPYFLLKTESLDSLSYFSILSSISNGNHKLNKLCGDLEVESNKLTPYLSRLVEQGFLKRVVPVTEKYPEKSRKGLYYIEDSFIRFWFRYLYPFKGELELGNTKIVKEELEKDFVENFAAFAFEDMAKDIFSELCRKEDIPFTPSLIGKYWFNNKSSDIEFDLVAIDKTHSTLFLGECKYQKKEVGESVFISLKEKYEKAIELKETFSSFNVLFGIFSKSGFTKNLIKEASNNDLILIDKGERIG